MPDSTTVNYGLVKPEVGASDDTWGTKLNANWTSIDAIVKAIETSVGAKLPSTSFTAAAVLALLLTVDGAGSGLDADKLDGQEAAAFALASDVTAAAILTKLLTIDGPGSGLDADHFDGLDSTDFSLATHNHDATYLKKIGDTISGALLRAGQGAFLHHVHDAMDRSEIFLTPEGDPDPTSQPGQIWLTF